jgi:hypothetical protein
MTAMRTIGLTGTLCALGLASILNAAVPTTRTAVTPGIINYQGMLLNPAGTPYSNGVYTLEFRIYDSETAVNAGLWASRTCGARSGLIRPQAHPTPATSG